jgi:CubicO group peptidase (beta-lactamase class C family)
MRPLSALLLAVTMLQFGSAAPAPIEQVYTRLGSYLDALRIQAGIPGMSAALVGQEGLLWEAAYGQRAIESSTPTATDTPYQVAGLTQIVTASVVLRCVEEGRLSLDDPISRFDKDNPDGASTLRQVLSHSSGPPGAAAFSYNLARLDPLTSAIRTCTNDSFRETMANLLEQFAMVDSVPGADILTLVPPDEGVPDAVEAQVYAAALARLATPYSVQGPGQATRSAYPETTLTPSTGLVASIHDLAKFDVALKQGFIVKPETLAAAWTPPTGVTGQALPHGLGWFVQSYNGETIVWQYGLDENAGSALMLSVPARGITLILLANSDGLVKPFDLSTGDLMVSPFARVFVGLLLR